MERYSLKRLTFFVPNEVFIQIQELCIRDKKSYTRFLKEAISLKFKNDLSVKQYLKK